MFPLILICFMVSFGSVKAYGPDNHQRVIDIGEKHFMILKQDGSVWTWGDNTYGQLGSNRSSTENSPVAVQKSDGNRLFNIIDISAGGNHSVALDLQGFVWTWGSNWRGQLGRTTSFQDSNPEIINNKQMGEIIAIAAGGNHTLAVDRNGEVWSWGLNYYGQLGNAVNTGTNNSNPTPVKISGLTDVIAVSAGEEHSVALKRDGTVWTWGRNSLGQLGNGQKKDINITPTVVPGLTGIMEISAGGKHTIALKQDRTTVWAWGFNGYGQLGDGGMELKLSPIQVEGMNDVRSISAGQYHSSVIREDGSVWMWGRHTSGTQTVRTTPIEVKGISNTISIGSGGDAYESYTLAVKSDGTVWKWDKNNSDTTTLLPIFIKVSGIDQVMKVNEFPFVQGNQVLFRFMGNGSTTDVKVVGTFNENIELPLTKKSGNVWELQATIPAGQYQYGLKVNGTWTVDPLNRDKFIDAQGRPFSLLNVSPHPEISPVINNKEVTFVYSSFDSISQLELDAETKTVSVAGNFGTNAHWVEIPLVKQRNNVWMLTKNLVPGDYYYSYVVRDKLTGAIDQKRNDALNPNLQTDTLTGISRNTFTVSEKVLTKIPVAGITLSKGPAFDMIVGEQISVTPTIKPANATNQNVNWYTSDNSVVSVEGGRLTAHASGTAVVSASTVDGGKVAMLTVMVNKEDNAVAYPRPGYKMYSDKKNTSIVKPWRIKFGKEFDIRTVNENSVYIMNESGIKVPLGYQAIEDGKTLEIRLLSGYTYQKGATYYLFVESSIKEKYGNRTLKEPVQMKFQIEL